ncbi:MAG: hypothetical protein Q8P67_09145 [archaeon]|nr:hypothetical protein [archaeon]
MGSNARSTGCHWERTSKRSPRSNTTTPSSEEATRVTNDAAVFPCSFSIPPGSFA